MRDFFVKALIEEAEKNPDLVFITGDLGFGVFEEFEKKFPNQYLNLGIAEQSMTGVAVGLGLEGRPVITYSIGNFPTMRCLEQIRNDAAYHNISLTIVSIGGGFSYGQLGMSHHATEDIAIMRALPNLNVYVPATNQEVEKISKICFTNKSTNYIRLDKVGADESSHNKKFSAGKIREICSGKEVAILATGSILQEAIYALEVLKNKHGLNVGIYSCHCLKPFDVDSLRFISHNYDHLISIEEHNSIGGLGSVICETIVKEDIQLKSYRQLSIKDTFSSVVGDQNFLRKYYGIASNDLVEAVLNLPHSPISPS